MGCTSRFPPASLAGYPPRAFRGPTSRLLRFCWCRASPPGTRPYPPRRTGQTDGDRAAENLPGFPAVRRRAAPGNSRFFGLEHRIEPLHHEKIPVLPGMGIMDITPPALRRLSPWREFRRPPNGWGPPIPSSGGLCLPVDICAARRITAGKVRLERLFDMHSFSPLSYLLLPILSENSRI